MVAILPSSSPFTSLHTNCSLRRLVSIIILIKRSIVITNIIITVIIITSIIRMIVITRYSINLITTALVSDCTSERSRSARFSLVQVFSFDWEIFSCPGFSFHREIFSRKDIQKDCKKIHFFKVWQVFVSIRVCACSYQGCAGRSFFQQGRGEDENPLKLYKRPNEKLFLHFPTLSPNVWAYSVQSTVSFAPLRPAGFVNFCGAGRGGARLAFRGAGQNI